MTDFARLAEQRLREAVERGELDGLPGQGQPLQLKDDGTPAELRVAYQILRNHGMVPQEVALLQRIDAARQGVAASIDPQQRAAALRQLEALCLEYNELRHLPVEREQHAGVKPPER